MEFTDAVTRPNSTDKITKTRTDSIAFMNLINRIAINKTRKTKETITGDNL